MTKLQHAAAVAAVFGFLASVDHVCAEQAPRTPGATRPAATDAKPIKTEEPGERARRDLDAQADRLEAEAKRLMQSICRGC